MLGKQYEVVVVQSAVAAVNPTTFAVTPLVAPVINMGVSALTYWDGSIVSPEKVFSSLRVATGTKEIWLRNDHCTVFEYMITVTLYLIL